MGSMGFSHDMTVHHFHLSPDGGAMEVELSNSDPKGKLLASVSSMVKNKPNKPLDQSFQRGCACPRYTTFDNISSAAPRNP
jgi:hypothetical protein